MAFNIGTGFDNTVYSIAIQSDSKILCVGNFTTYSGVTSNRIIRLNTDGSINTSFNIGTGFNSTVISLALQSDGKILVGGAFTTYQGTTANRIIRLNTNGSIDTSFVYGTGFNNVIWSLALQSDGKILVGGSFTTYNGTSINRIIRLNSNGSIDTSFNIGTGFSGSARSFALQSDGKILVGGSFTTYNGTSINRIIRLNSNGSIDNTFNVGTGFNGDIFSIGLQSDGKILVGGFYTTYSGATSNRIIRLNSNGSIDNTFNVGTGFNYDVYHVSIQSDGKIIVTGDYGSYNGTSANRIIRLNTDGSIDTSFVYGTGFNNRINTTEIQSDGKILVGGYFTTYKDLTYFNRIIRLNTDGSIDNVDIFLAPSGLTVTSVANTSVGLSWTNNSENDGIDIYYSLIGGTWLLFSSTTSTTTSINVTDLEMDTEYRFKVVNKSGINTLDSNIVTARTTVTYVQPFCQGENYIVNDTLLGNHGSILIDIAYFEFYDIVCKDVSGNTYTYVTNGYSNLPASWYFLTATPKPRWWSYYGNQPCVVEWIPLNNMYTKISQTYVSNRDANCGGFGSIKGRLVYGFNDTSISTFWSFNLWTDDVIKVNHQDVNQIDAIVYTSKPGNYYGTIKDNLGYVLLINIVQVKADTMFNALPEITEIYLTEYNSTISYNYYSSSDEDWYVASLDPLAYTSTKIKEFINTGDWYKINLNTATITYNQGLNKGSNGLTYTETVNISIPQQEYTKWLELTNILTNSYIIVFKDANDKYWTVGYRNGTSVQSYKLSQNQYVFSFISNAVSKLLTNLDNEYVKLHIL